MTDTPERRERQIRRKVDTILDACSDVAKSRFYTVDQAIAWLRHLGCRDQAARLGMLSGELETIVATRSKHGARSTS